MGDYERAERLPFGAKRDAVRTERETALREALHGVELYTDDERIITWAASMLDAPTVQTIVSWLSRVRRVGYWAGVQAHGGEPQ